jgi:hypothetical protein
LKYKNTLAQYAPHLLASVSACNCEVTTRKEYFTNIITKCSVTLAALPKRKAMYLAEQQITVPALGKPFTLGALYNARTQTVMYTGLSPWSNDVLNRAGQAPIPHTDQTVRQFIILFFINLLFYYFILFVV